MFQEQISVTSAKAFIIFMKVETFSCLCLFFLLGKQAHIKPGLYKKDGIHILSLCLPPAAPHVCGTQKGKRVPQGGGISSVPQTALNQLHITKPPCRAPGPGYSCWDKFIHGCMGSCLIEAHYLHFLLTLCTPRRAAQASAGGRGWNSCCCSCGRRRG